MNPVTRPEPRAAAAPVRLFEMLLLQKPLAAHLLTTNAILSTREESRVRIGSTRLAPGKQPVTRDRETIDQPLARHLPALDGLRGWAILTVLLHHFTPQAVGGSPFTRALLAVTHAGWTGVDLFFVLSGFLITGILLRTREKPNFFLNFYARRTLRIFPLYYGSLVLLLIVVPLLARGHYTGPFMQAHFKTLLNALPDMLPGQGWLWLYGTNFKIAIDQERWQFVNHFWSLAVEEHFYMLWPLVVFHLSKKSLVGVCGLCLFSAPLLRLAAMAGGFDSVVPYVMTPCRADSLALGGLMAVLVNRPGGLVRWLPRLRWAALASAALLAAIIIAYGRLDRRDGVTTAVGYTLLGLLSAWAVLEASRVTKSRTIGGAFLLNPLARSLGKYSYGLYVLHVFLIPTFVNWFGWRELTRLTGSYAAAIFLHAGLAIACSWLMAYASFHLFEKHFLRLKILFDYGTPARPIYEATKLPLGNVEIRKAA